MSSKTKHQSRRGTKKTRPSRARLLLWLALPTLILLPLVLLSTFLHLPTRIQLDLTTARLAFTLGGDDRREILARSVAFSALTLEGCDSVSFAAEKLEIAAPHSSPAITWRTLTPSDPVKLRCDDPAAKLTLQSPDPAAPRLGTLDRVYLDPNSQVILEISSDPEPALTLDVGAPQRLSLPLERDIELVTSFLALEGLALPASPDLLTFRARLPESHRMLDLASSERGLVLIVTPAREQLAELFLDKLDLPLTSVELLEEDLDGRLVSPLRDQATLSYPDYPTIPAVTLESGDFIGLDTLSQTRLRTLELDAEKSALRVRFDGIAEHATTRAGAFTTDRRLTLFHIFRYSWRWDASVVVAFWLIATTWAAYGAWKKLPK